jgi:hypothetical protein
VWARPEERLSLIHRETASATSEIADLGGIDDLHVPALIASLPISPASPSHLCLGVRGLITSIRQVGSFA